MKRVVMSLVVVLLCSGCFIAPVVPPVGIGFSSFKAPLDVENSQTTVSARRGEASSVCVLFLFSFGEAGIEDAARAGGLRVVNHADYEYLNVLGIFQKYTTIVYGE
ncbi:MAG TPA: TRL domain-containing protein [bacterium]|nr:TRL domain-containing protein [bacterium]